MHTTLRELPCRNGMGKPMIFPTIHLNGSNGTVLELEYRAAYDAARELLSALEAIDLNARDYYVQPDPQAFQIAREQSSARYVAVKNVRKKLETIILAISQQRTERTVR